MDAKSTHKFTNSLIQETSPYLLQHAHNPVDWYAWNKAALDKARREDKPILLSIGYSACHWCHVMEHESFEDEGVARVMNDLFVCIKVDREERPDLDKIYQLAHQLLAQRPGGWPLTVFLAPDDHTPFFAGTYFPKEPRYGMPGFPDLLQRVANYYRDHRVELQQHGVVVREAFARIEPSGPEGKVEVRADLLQSARQELESQFDRTHAGFGGAPKFPHPTSLERLLRHWALDEKDAGALAIVRQTLTAMGSGGIYDQLGGGFYRYSVDERWMIPHFEKMLYDNGPLLALYADAALATDDPLFRRIAIETGEWAMREMQSPEGGYYSTLDADSEGHEGKFYVWTREEVRSLLSDEEYAPVELRFGLDRSPNFENRWWHLHVFENIGSIADKLDIAAEVVEARLSSARQKLFDARAARVHPGRDEKVLTAWNGLMIKGMARAGRLLDRPDFTASAQRALDFIRGRLWTGDRLLAAYKDGKAHLNAYLDDYAFMIDGGLELAQAQWREGDLEFLAALADVLLARFEDAQNGGFFFTSSDHEQLLFRPKPAGDEAIPSGNGVAAQALLRLGHLLGESRYLDAAERTLKALLPSAARYPSAHNALLTALEEQLYPSQTVILRGDPPEVATWRARAQAHYAPRRLLLDVPRDARRLPGLLAQQAPTEGVIAYVCTGQACSAPTREFAQYVAALRTTEAVPA